MVGQVGAPMEQWRRRDKEVQVSRPRGRGDDR